MRWRSGWSLRLTLGVGLLGSTLAWAQQILVPSGAAWRYRKGTEEASNPVAVWRARTYNAAGWLTGDAPFHYGDGLATGTQLDDMRGGYTCLFLRREFQVTNRSEITGLRLVADYDDGFIAWINGAEIARSGVAGEPVYSDVASASHEGGSPVTFTPAPSPGSLLVDGLNVLAVQAFNRSLSASTDFRFDAALEVDRQDALVPEVTAYLPEGPEVATLTEVTVVFSEPVSGVGAGDLLVNDRPAVQVNGAPGTTSYTFRFTQPPPGLVAITWSEANQIRDLQGNLLNTEAPSSVWSYTLRDSLGPQLLVVTPRAGVVVSQLGQVEMIFDEPVVGLDAADLLVNGQPATSLAGRDAGPYVFGFPEPSSGVVRFTWAAGHGVTDIAPDLNAFTGEGWTVTLNPALALGDVVINEFVASNETGLRDEDGEAHDWIELHNRSGDSVNLLGWSLTDDPAVPGKWTFPSRTLAPGQYLVVFASGKDRRTPAGANRFHANFKLNAFGEYLALHNAEFPRVVVSEFLPAYPEQRRNIAYGLSSAGDWRYFETPTPGAGNGSSAIAGMAPEPHFSVERGTFEVPFNVLLTSALPGASIRYTLDGSEPTASGGFLYTAPLRVTNTTVLRAVVFRDTYLPSRTRTHSYLFLDQVMHQSNQPAGFPATWGNWSGFPDNQVPADYGMDLDPLRTDPNNPNAPLDAAKVERLKAGLRELPVVSLVMKRDDLFGPNGLYPRASDGNKTPNEKPCSLELLLPDGTTAFVTEAGLDLHGNASRSPLKNPKHGFKLTFKSDYGPTTLRYRLFPDSPVEEFDDLLLRPDFNTSWRHWSDSRGNGNGAFQRSRGTRTRYAWSQETFRDMGQVSTHTRCFHLFLNGLYWGTYDFAEQPTDHFAANYYGGEVGEHDVYDQGALRLGSSAAYNAMLGVSGLGTLAGYERMKQYLDIPQFIDYMLLHFYVGHQDWGDRKNWYAIRPQATDATGTFKYLPWDQECILLEENVNRVPGGGGDVPSGLHTKLDDNPQYRLDFADRAFKHLVAPGGALTPEANIARWRKSQALMDNAIVAESCRWGDYRRDVHRYSDGTYELYTREQHWLAENERLVNSYFVNRGEIVLGQLRAAGLYPAVGAPQFNQAGGRVPTGFALTLSAPAGTIHFTLDGTDPRNYGSSTVAPSAVSYAGPIPLEGGVTVKARVLHNGVWSALHEATFTVAELGLPLRFTEIMYHPVGGDAFEFIELQNLGGVPIEASGFSLRGVDFVFPDNTMILAGATVVLAAGAHPQDFEARYPGTPVLGWFGGSLANGGERLALVARDGRIVTAVHYDDEAGWPAGADGAGYSLEVVDPRGDPNAPANWRASALVFGTPGQVASPPTPASVVLNEVMAENLAAVAKDGAFPDWLELHNQTAAPISLANWSLTDNSDPRAYVFPAGTVMPAQAYLVVWCDNASTGSDLHTGFALGRRGETLRLFDASTNLVDALSYGLQVPDLTVGRVGGEWRLTQPTPGAANVAMPLAGRTNLALNEWLAASGSGGEDWLELYNRSTAAPVALQGLYLGTSEALHRIVSLSFLAAGGYAQLFADEQPGADHLEFRLPAEGGVIVLYDSTGFELERVAYGPQRLDVSEGRLPDGATAIRSFVGSASPGASNYLRSYAGPILNEVLARNQRASLAPWGAYADWIELYHPGPGLADLSGMALGRTVNDESRWAFPMGTTMRAQSHLVVWCDGTRPPSDSDDPGATLNTGFSLAGAGGEVVLFNAMNQPVDWVRHGAQLPDLSIGREGAAGWRLLDAPTPGLANSTPAVLGAANRLRFNEWMAEPVSGADWFELYNPGSQPVELSGLFLSDNPSLHGATNSVIGPLSFIGAGGWVRWEADDDVSGAPNRVGFRLDGAGETLRLYSTDRVLLEAVDYGLQTAGVSEGRMPDGATGIVRFPGSASPGAGNHLTLTNVVINEVLSHADPPFEDAIELHNPTLAPVAVGGWYLSDDARDLKRYRIPDTTVIEPGGYRVFYLDQFGTADGEEDVPPRFGLNGAHGDAVYLCEADAQGSLTGRRTGVTFGAAANGVSFGRHLTSQGAEFVAQRQLSLGFDQPLDVARFRTGGGRPNAGPLIGPIVINEILYAPSVGDQGEFGGSVLEFVELCNSSDRAVSLFDPAHPGNGWRLADAVDFVFPPQTTLLPGACLAVVSFDPVNDPATLAAFQAAYGSGGTLIGPYTGRLANTGENLELLRPDPPQELPSPDAGFVPYVLVDRVRYAAEAPWPTNLIASGASLQRIAPDLYGNDPANWTTASSTPGWTGGGTDTDADGMPDEWEREHGTNPSTPDADGDLDTDGLSNLEEYLAGTDPRSAASVLALRVVALEGGTLTIEFLAQPARSYTVLTLEAWGGTSWARLADVEADSVERTVRVFGEVSPVGARFYRVVTPAWE